MLAGLEKALRTTAFEAAGENAARSQSSLCSVADYLQKYRWGAS
jgi:hypothetical protein